MKKISITVYEQTHSHVHEYFNALFILLYLCNLCPMRLNYNWHLWMTLCHGKLWSNILPTCVIKYLDVHLFFSFLKPSKLCFSHHNTSFMKMSVCTGAALALWKNWINECRNVKNEWFSNAKSIWLILSTPWGRCGPPWDCSRAMSGPWAVFCPYVD